MKKIHTILAVLILTAMQTLSAQSFPTYTFTLPKPITNLVDPDEAVITNGEISTALVGKDLNTYVPSQLRRILSPPYLLNNSDSPTLGTWGFDDVGDHYIDNSKFTMNFNLQSLTCHIDSIKWEGKVNSFWSVTINYTTIPDKRVLIATYSYKNISQQAHPLKIGAWLVNPQVTKDLNWSWKNGSTGNVNAAYNPSIGHGAIATSSVLGDAHLLFGLNKSASSHAVTISNEWPQWTGNGTFSGTNTVSNTAVHNQYLSHDFGSVPSGDSVTVSIVLSIDGNQGVAQSNFLDAITNLSTRFSDAETYWNNKWEATKVEIESPDAGINRMSHIALGNSVMAWDNINRGWVTNFSRNARGLTYLWDLWYAGIGSLVTNSDLVKENIIRMLEMDVMSHYAARLFDDVGVGPWYAYNHVAITELVYNYVTITGDTDFLNQTLQGGTKTPLQILFDQIIFINDTKKYDFGGNRNLLEVLSDYVGVVPDLVAATYWMGVKIKALALRANQPAIALKCDQIASTAYQKTQSLWDPGIKWFKTGSGGLAYTSQIFNMIYTGALTREQVTGLLERKDDFILDYGTRSLASYDNQYAPISSARGDWDGPGNYSGNPGTFMRALSYAGYKDDLLALSKGVSSWWQWRPYQPQGIVATTGQAIGGISADGTNNCVARYFETVPLYMVGIRYALGGIDIYDSYPTSWNNAAGKVSFNKKQYSAKVSVPYRGFKYTFFIDKPLVGDDRYTSASIYNSSGTLLKEWHSQRMPTLNQDLIIVLHFNYQGPQLTQLDELTYVDSAGLNSYAMNNLSGEINFSLRKAGNGTASFTIKNTPERSYNILIDNVLKAVKFSNAQGQLTFTHTVDDSIDIIKIVDAGPIRRE